MSQIRYIAISISVTKCPLPRLPRTSTSLVSGKVTKCPPIASPHVSKDNLLYLPYAKNKANLNLYFIVRNR